MLKERVKSAVIFVLILNCLFLTSQIWFRAQLWPSGHNFFASWESLPVIRGFFERDEYSIPKDSLSVPRKFVIYNGSLWVPYYATNAAFSPLEERTRAYISAVLGGEGEAREISADDWTVALSLPGIYVEYPISFTPELLGAAMGVDYSGAVDLDELKDYIILPSEGSNPVRLLLRDFGGGAAYMYALPGEYSLPRADLNLYAQSAGGYYEFAFNMNLSSSGDGEPSAGVHLAPLVLFSDVSEVAPVIAAQPAIGLNEGALLERFSFNPKPLRQYVDAAGAQNFVENYATLKIAPDGLVEYRATSDERGIQVSADGSLYSSLYGVIDFAESVWAAVSDAPLSVLVTSDLIDSQSGDYVFTFDWYQSGKPVAVLLDGCSHAIEAEVHGGRIVRYRHLLRSYAESGKTLRSRTFVEALDDFARQIGQSSAVIEDMYLAYPEYGDGGEIAASWVAIVDGGILVSKEVDGE